MRSSNSFSWDSKLIRFIEFLMDLFIIVVCGVVADSAKSFVTNGNFFILIDALMGAADFAEIQKFMTLHGVYLFFVTITFYIYKTSITNKNYYAVMANIIISLILATVSLLIVSAFLPDFSGTNNTFDPLQAVMSFILQIIIFGLYKYVLWRFLRRKNRKLILICGPKLEAEKLSKKIILDGTHYKRIKYLYYEINQKIDEDIFPLIDEVDIVYLTEHLYEKNKNKILLYCINQKRKDVCMVPKIYELGIVNSDMENMGDILTFGIKSMNLSVEQRFVKRTFDIMIALFGLIVSFPILIVCGLIVKLQDKGEIIFKQDRLTRNGRVFKMYKLRSMKMNAEKESGIIQAAAKDPRVTKFGKFLRRSRIDEIPQLWNVLKGEMSLVGPRPERPVTMEEIKQTIPDFEYRQNVKPGITGLAQTIGTYSTKYDDKLRYDLLYIRKYSFWYDIKIILYTIKSVFDKKSAMGISEESSFEEVLMAFKIKNDVINEKILTLSVNKRDKNKDLLNKENEE